MKNLSNSNFEKRIFLMLAGVAIVAFTSNENAFSQEIPGTKIESSAAELLKKHEILELQLMKNIYHRPLVFESQESDQKVSSAVYAILNSPFSVVNTTFKNADLWCEVLILHLNTKYCKSNQEPMNPAKLVVNIGKKTPQRLEDTFSLEFSHRVIAQTPQYLGVALHADKGPLNTTDYQLELRAIPLPEGKTFINLRYSYGYGMAGKLAMQTYLSTLGRGKFGFSQLTSQENPGYVGGMRGAVERNTMRYYLAIEAYLASLKQSSLKATETKFQYWFDATEEYAPQLREMDRLTYLSMKKNEYYRQQNTPLSSR